MDIWKGSMLVTGAILRVSAALLKVSVDSEDLHYWKISYLNPIDPIIAMIPYPLAFPRP